MRLAANALRACQPLRRFGIHCEAVGKTTVARRLGALLREAGVPLAGFVTEELREGGLRVGFAIESFDGARGVLAHVGLLPAHRESESTASTWSASRGSPSPRWRPRPWAASC